MSSTKAQLTLLQKLKAEYPEIQFEEAEQFFWSPKTRSVKYKSLSDEDLPAKWALLHEVSHGLLRHTDYSCDFELIKLEVLAWEYAERLAVKYSIPVDSEHVQDCLDTYRDWLHRRSACPQCGLGSIQYDSTHYMCHSCDHVWAVSKQRFCRPYRLVKNKV